jgi:hypothetical protein
MLSKCANPACIRPFLSLNRGKLFLLETDCSVQVLAKNAASLRKGRIARRTERYWLCDDCSSLLTLTFERGRGMVTVPLPPRKNLLPGLHLTHVQLPTHSGTPSGNRSRHAGMKGTL